MDTTSSAAAGVVSAHASVVTPPTAVVAGSAAAAWSAPAPVGRHSAEDMFLTRAALIKKRMGAIVDTDLQYWIQVASALGQTRRYVE